MASAEDQFIEYPEDARRTLRRAWDALPPEARDELLGVLPLLPVNRLTRFQNLMRLSLKQFRMAFGDKRAVAIVGPANVGKSTLYNKLIRAKRDVAAVGPVPGTTRENQVSDAGLFAIVDTPGADAVGEVGERERKLALQAAEEVDFLVVMFDAIQGVKRTEQDLFEELRELGKPYIVVLNKMDLVRRQRKRAIETAAANLDILPTEIIPITAQSGRHLERVLLAIVKAEPELLAALGQALPPFRWQLAWRSITGAATTAGLIGLTPIPFLDFIPLLALQSSLVLGIARVYNYRMTLARARELVGTFALGFLGRTLFYELGKLGGPPGWVLAASIAAATTVVMGYAAIIWFERGERLTSTSIKKLTKIVTAFLVDRLKRLGKRKPSRSTLSEELQQAINEAPIGQEHPEPNSLREEDLQGETGHGA